MGICHPMDYSGSASLGSGGSKRGSTASLTVKVVKVLSNGLPESMELQTL